MTRDNSTYSAHEPHAETGSTTYLRVFAPEFSEGEFPYLQLRVKVQCIIFTAYNLKQP